MVYSYGIEFHVHHKMVVVSSQSQKHSARYDPTACFIVIINILTLYIYYL